MSRALIIIVLFISASANLMCSRQTENPGIVNVVSKLVISPTIIALQPGLEQCTLFVRTNVSSRDQDWNIVFHPDWLKPKSLSGRTKGGVDTIAITVDFSNMNAGITWGNIEISGESDTEYVTALCTLFVAPSSLSFTLENTQSRVEYFNASNKLQTLVATCKATWLTRSADSIMVMGQDKAAITFAVDSSRFYSLAYGVYKDTIVFAAGDKRCAVAVDLLVKESSLLRVSSNQIFLCGPGDTAHLPLSNGGQQLATWKILTDSVITISPSEGALQPGTSQSITFGYNTARLHNDEHIGKAFIVCADGSVCTLTVFIKNKRQNYFRVNANPLSARYSKKLQRLVLIDKDSSLAFIIDPNTCTCLPVPLSRPPRCLTLNLGGTMAAIGHDSLVSLINLTDMTVGTIPVPVQSDDIMMNDSNIYIIPLGDQWVNIFVVNIHSKKRFFADGIIPSASTGIMHQSGTALYTVDYGISPQTMNKFKVLPDTAFLAPLAPGWPEENMGTIWFSDDSGYILSSSGKVFHRSTDSTVDMSLAGTIGSGFEWMIKAATGGYFYGAPVNSTETINRYTDLDFLPAGSDTLPRVNLSGHFAYNETTLSAMYAFLDTQAGAIYAVASTRLSSTNAWVICTIPVTDFK
jgi:hypothetical protein